MNLGITTDEPRQLAYCVNLAQWFLSQNSTDRTRDVATIIFGYAELYNDYPCGEFPLWRIGELLNEMASGIPVYSERHNARRRLRRWINRECLRTERPAA